MFHLLAPAHTCVGAGINIKTMRIEKNDKEFRIITTVPIAPFDSTGRIPRNKINPIETEEVQQHLHNILISRMDECCSGVKEMLVDGTIKADEYCLYGSHYFSFIAFNAMQELAAKKVIKLEECTRLQLNQLAKALVYLPSFVDIELREQIFDSIIDALETKGWNEK